MVLNLFNVPSGEEWGVQEVLGVLGMVLKVVSLYICNSCAWEINTPVISTSRLDYSLLNDTVCLERQLAGGNRPRWGCCGLETHSSSIFGKYSKATEEL